MGEAKFKVLSVLKKFMSDEQYEAFKDKATEFEAQLNGDITKYIDTNSPKLEDLKVEAKKTAHSEVIKELGIAGVENTDQLKAHVKVVSSKTSEKDEEVLRLSKELEAKSDEFDELNGKYENSNKLNVRTDTKAKIKQAGFNDTFNDDLVLVALSQVNENNDLDTVIANMKTTTHKHYLTGSDFSASIPGEEHNEPSKISDEEVASWLKDAGVEEK